MCIQHSVFAVLLNTTNSLAHLHCLLLFSLLRVIRVADLKHAKTMRFLRFLTKIPDQICSNRPSTQTHAHAATVASELSTGEKHGGSH